MANLHNYTIQFVSLRAETLYTLTIGGSSGSTIALKGGAQPFSTQEDDNEDLFTPIRTQSGYIRIVDDGFAADGITPFDWKDLLPETDTDRPVTLTDDNGNVVWQGYMQAQTFSGTLYGNPQQRDFPVQCVLTVTQGADINYQQTQIQNFAYLLKQIVDSIPSSQRPTTVAVQGGATAQEWLMKCIDWQNFSDVDDEDNQSARLTMFQCLEDMCRFWGWTARVCGSTLYLTCADDASLSDWLTMDDTQLASLAAGTTAGTISSAPSVIDPIGDIYASVDNDDFVTRGYNKSMVTVDTNPASDYVIDPFDDKLEKEMKAPTWNEGYITSYDGVYVHYTEDVLEANRFYLKAEAAEGSASFNIISKYGGTDVGYNDIGNCISIHKTYDGTTFVTLETVYEHCFSDGFFRLQADIYRNGDKYEQGDFFAGEAAMIMRLGVGRTREDAKWWDGRAWQDGVRTFLATIGNKKPDLFSRYDNGIPYEQTNIIAANNLAGRVFIDILGTNDSRFADVGGQKRFAMKDFRVKFQKNNTVAKTQYPNSGWWDISELDRPSRYVYKSSNNNRVRNEYDVDAVYGSDSQMVPGYSILLNPNKTYLTTLNYNGTNKHPEQYLADRVTTYYGTSKRKLNVELCADLIGQLTPKDRMELDGTTGHPIAISHEWRDDVLQITLLEL